MNQTALLKRCQAIAEEPGDWTEDDLAGFFHRYRPSGSGLEKLYADVPRGDEIVKRLKAVLSVDGTDEGLSLSVNKPLPVEPAKAVSIVKKFFTNMRRWGNELAEDDLTDAFPANADFVARPGEIGKYRDNKATHEALCVLCDLTEGALSDAAGPKMAGVIMTEAVYTLVYDFPLTYYIQWPNYAKGFQAKDPFRPHFDMWHHKVKWRLVARKRVEVFSP